MCSSVESEQQPSCCAASRDAALEAAPVVVLNERPLARAVAPDLASDGMVKLPGGAFLMGNASGGGYPADGEGPVHLDPLWIDPTTVTNARFAAFVAATG
jgi:formylglycine-generating enzyme required for sulfatase activity